MKEYQNDDHRLICALSPDLTPRQIGKKFSISPDAVRAICKMYGVQTRDGRNYNASVAGLVREAIKSNPNLMPRQIAEITGCTPEYVRKVRLAMGEKKEPRCLTPVKVMQSLVAKIDHLRGGGMTIKEAALCIGTSPATYARYKKALE